MMPYLTAGLYIAVLGGLYALTYLMNSRTPVPENCKDLLVGCETCSTGSCGHRPIQNVKEN